MLDIRYFRNPAFSTGTGGMILVFFGMFGVMFLMTQYFQLVLGLSPLGAALRFLPMAPIMIVVVAADAPAHRPLRRPPDGRGRHDPRRRRSADARGHRPAHPVPLRACLPHPASSPGIALTMSPMTASIMSAVPPRRAGVGSAMNDATRELGAALGVAVLGSLAASRYTAKVARSLVGLTPAARHTADSSVAGALQVAADLKDPDAGHILATGAQTAFIDGIHLAVTVGAAIAAAAAVIVLRYLPHVTTHDAGRPRAPEAAVEIGVAGLATEIGDRGHARPAPSPVGSESGL